MSQQIANQLHKDGFINKKHHQLLTAIYSKKVYSLYYEHKSILLVGVISLATGLGLLIYKNGGSIGHQVILGSITALTFTCFWYVTKKREPLRSDKVQTPGLFYDYVLLLGCLLFLTLESYLEFQYSIFQERWDIWALIPALMFFYLAYVHDHQGVLTMAITGLTSWVGINATPKAVLAGELFADLDFVVTGIFYSLFLTVFALILNKVGLKRHFTFTYLNFGANLLSISILYGLFNKSQDWLYFLLLLFACVSFFYYARKQTSFVFLLYSSLYGYTGLSYLILKNIHQDSTVVFLYFTISAGLMVLFLFNYKKIFKLIS